MSVLDMNIKSSFKYQVIFFLSAAIHITFLILFLINEIYVLAGFNVFSILYYLIGGIVTGAKFFEQHNSIWTILTYLEITVHSILGTLWLGFDTCFFLYSIVALTVACYIVYLTWKKKDFFKVIIPLAISTFTALIFCYVFLLIKPPFVTLFFNREIAEGRLQVFKGVNIFLNSFIVFFFSVVFIAEMHSLMEKLEKTNQKLNYIAMHDTLTGLYNRHSLKEVFARFLGNHTDSAGTYSAEAPVSIRFCVIMGDVDNFKSINDTYGHNLGDVVLKGVASIIKEGVADDNIACRWGGEEFLILMKGNKEDCTDRIERIRQSISELRIEEEPDLIVTMTFGLVFCSERNDATVQLKNLTRIEELVQIADERLYQGKSHGKNIVIYQ